MTQKNSRTTLPTALIMAGGTGGHIFPGIALARLLNQRGWNVSWLGAKGGMEEKLVAAEEIELNLISVKGLRGNGLLGWMKAPYSLIRAVAEAIRIIREKAPLIVVGFGGFASGPGGLAAFLTGRTLVIHEQNAIAGLTNRVLAKVSDKVFQAFPGAFRASAKVQTVGNPLREDILQLSHVDSKTRVESQPINILVIGGSRGALSLNQFLPGIFAGLLKENKIQIRHQVGSKRLQETRKYYQESGVQESEAVQLFEFIENMAEAFKWADLIICRAGASTVSEVAAAGRCAIFIPYPYAVDDHQTANANWLVEQQAALCYSEKEMKEEQFVTKLKLLVNSPDIIDQMATRAKSSAYLDAAGKLADYCDAFRKQAT